MPTLSDSMLLWGGIALLVLLACLLGPSRLS